ncbi:Protein kinase-like domain protein [Niveomyces insectorum RCEF 264]|uniref:Protein kinase-like domain protein n=1 Tax=Niveomyces insectorum RCEF 264 TaxID=1081102 RepID=A0A167YRX3_9HYPO|nr:Protein kinase-like domain protein [Niveomyces insectorum RCEF 264]
MANHNRAESTHYPVTYDDVFNERCIRLNGVWESKILARSRIRALEAFVGRQMDNRGPVRFLSTARGAYNIVLKFHIRDGRAPRHVALRFPQPGFSPAALVAERLENEVHWMQFFEEEQIAPVPHIYSWSAVPGPDGMDPYIMMDFIDGESLHTLFTRWKTSKDAEDEAKRRFVYEQLAAIVLALSRPRFDKIGSITRAVDGSWAVTRRPLTYDMHAQLSGIPHFPTDAWPTGPLQSAREYRELVAGIRHQQMLSLRSINIPGAWNTEGYFDLQAGSAINMERAMATARGRVVARRATALPACTPHLDNDHGPFAIVCPDLCLRDFLVDPATGRITAMLDLEFTNALPVAFAHDPPVWLTTSNLDRYLEYGLLPYWQEQFQTAWEAFVGILERIEPGPPSLSARMRESWARKTYLLHHALNRSDVADIIYHELPALFPAVVVDPQEVEAYQTHTRRQIAAYEEERAALSGTTTSNETGAATTT